MHQVLEKKSSPRDQPIKETTSADARRIKTAAG